MSQELVDSVNKLTGETTKLLLEYTDSNTTLKNSAASAKEDASKAAMSESAAATSNTEAKNAELAAKAEADRAELAASQAAQVAGLDTVEQAVAQALADGGYTWRTEADMIAMREQNNAMFAASGFVHFGKHFINGDVNKPINEGLYTIIAATDANRLLMGRGTTSPTGNSKSNNPVINIAGFLTELEYLNYASSDKYQSASIKFPEAEAGTRVYNSETGVSIDYAKEVDPKYGDIAPDHNEAVARAFEGVLPNGDFRFDPVDHTDVWQQMTWTGDSIQFNNVGASARFSTSPADHNSELNRDVTIQFFIKTAASGGATNPDSSYGARLSVHLEDGTKLTNADGLWGDYIVGRPEAGAVSGEWQEFKVPASYITSPVSKIELYTHTDYGSGLEIGAIHVSHDGQEVVTNRVDMFGFEGFLGQVTPTNPFVYRYGIIQSKANDIDGIATTQSNRPESYYAVYDGDTTSRGKGVDFLSLSVLEQDQIANNPKNHIYRMANGDIVQWRIRQRTVAGANNGDWECVDSTATSGYLQSVHHQNARTVAQGHDDEVSNNVSTEFYLRTKSSLVEQEERHSGVFSCRAGRNSYNDSGCYFLVCGTVSRLNQGAYHPNLNPLGTKAFMDVTGLSSSIRKWYESSAKVPRNTGDCFKAGTEYIAGNVPPFVHSGLGSGAIEGELLRTGRPDGRFYDAIYDGGLGGVCDYRLSAWDKSSKEDAAEIIQKVNTGQYRGRELLKKMIPCTVSNLGWSYEQILKEDGTALTLSDIDASYHALITSSYGALTARDIGIACPGPDMQIAKSGSILVVPGTTYNGTKLLCPTYTNTTVEGEFTQTDVIGDPTNILQVDALKDGWLGSWLGVAEGNQDKYLTRKSMTSASLQSQPRTDDLGATWYTTGIAQDNVQNLVRWTLDANTVAVVNYSAFAKQTKSSNLEKPLHGASGLGDVFFTNSYSIRSGALLVEAMTGLILVDADASSNGAKPLINYNIDYLGQLNSGVGQNKKLTHDIFVPRSSGSNNVKYLPIQVEQSNQVTLSYLFQEFSLDGLTSGEDGTFNVIAGGTNTYTDLHGVTCLQGIAELAVPYGWVKNEI